MTLKIIEHKKNALMGRDEVKALYEHPGKPTPTREEILPSLESVLKMSGEHIIIERIFTTKGKGESLVKALVYEEKSKMPKHKLDVIEKRKAKRGAKTAGAEATAAKK
ncbi:MAG: hypothetical protein NTU57_00610 [Candidatus Aenigmarchaeota archaeon]|nr:hypothetical protein [Candidatus Aenigmarchaeota archaeon]